MNRVFVLHHNDLDGRLSGAIVKKKYSAAELHEINYGDAIPWEEMAGADLYIVDFSLLPADMARALGQQSNVVWIDHHQTAINQLYPTYESLPGIRSMEQAGCRLTWDYLFPHDAAPNAVYYVADRDLWRFDIEETKPFCAALAHHDWPADDEQWQILLDKLLDGMHWASERLVTEGDLILDVVAAERKRALADAYETRFHGYRTLAINRPGTGELGEDIYRQGYDVAYCYVERPLEGRLIRKVSLYSPTVDVSHLAQLYGGGGHRAAAGFIQDLGPLPERLNPPCRRCGGTGKVHALAQASTAEVVDNTGTVHYLPGTVVVQTACPACGGEA